MGDSKSAPPHGENCNPAPPHGENSESAPPHGENCKPAPPHGENSKPAPPYGEERGTRSIFEIPVDQGWAWVVLTGVFIKEFLTAGLLYMVFGVMYLEFLDYYSASPAATAWVGSVTVVLSSVWAPLASYLAIYWSVRTLTLIATVFITAGLISSMFLPSVYYLYLTLGLLVGSGYSLIALSTIALLKKYFDRHLGLAIGIGYSGMGFGLMAGPPLFVFLVEEYTLKGTLLIWGGILLHLAVCALLMRPTHFYDRKHTSKRAACEHKSDEKASDLEKISTDETKTPKVIMLRVGLLKKPHFVIFNIVIVLLFTASFPMVALIIPAHADSIGLPRPQVALLSTVMGVGQIVGRPLLGFIADRKRIPMHTFFMVLCCAAAALTVALPHVGHTMAPLAVTSGLMAFMGSPMLTIPVVLLRDLVPPHHYTMATGWMGLFLGIPHMYNYSLFAYISEGSGRWDLSFYICGVCFLLGGFVTFINHRCCVAKSADQEAEETMTTRL